MTDKVTPIERTMRGMNPPKQRKKTVKRVKSGGARVGGGGDPSSRVPKGPKLRGRLVDKLV